MLDNLIKTLGLVLTLLRAIVARDYPAVVPAAWAIVLAYHPELTPLQGARLAAAHPAFATDAARDALRKAAE